MPFPNQEMFDALPPAVKLILGKLLVEIDSMKDQVGEKVSPTISWRIIFIKNACKDNDLDKISKYLRTLVESNSTQPNHFKLLSDSWTALAASQKKAWDATIEDSTITLEKFAQASEYPLIFKEPDKYDFEKLELYNLLIKMVARSTKTEVVEDYKSFELLDFGEAHHYKDILQRAFRNFQSTPNIEYHNQLIGFLRSQCSKVEDNDEILEEIKRYDELAKYYHAVITNGLDLKAEYVVKGLTTDFERRVYQQYKISEKLRELELDEDGYELDNRVTDEIILLAKQENHVELIKLYPYLLKVVRDHINSLFELKFCVTPSKGEVDPDAVKQIITLSKGEVDPDAVKQIITLFKDLLGENFPNPVPELESVDVDSYKNLLALCCYTYVSKNGPEGLPEAMLNNAIEYLIKQKEESGKKMEAKDGKLLLEITKEIIINADQDTNVPKYVEMIDILIDLIDSPCSEALKSFFEELTKTKLPVEVEPELSELNELEFMGADSVLESLRKVLFLGKAKLEQKFQSLDISTLEPNDSIYLKNIVAVLNYYKKSAVSSISPVSEPLDELVPLGIQAIEHYVKLLEDCAERIELSKQSEFYREAEKIATALIIDDDFENHSKEHSESIAGLLESNDIKNPKHLNRIIKGCEKLLQITRSDKKHAGLTVVIEGVLEEALKSFKVRADGDTYLHYIFRTYKDPNEIKYVIDALLRQGADLKAENKAGKTSLECASPEIIQHLLSENKLKAQLKVEENADLMKRPKVVAEQTNCAVIGDLHGCSVKMLHFLISQGVVELGAEPDKAYAAYVKQYLAAGEDANAARDYVSQLSYLSYLSEGLNLAGLTIDHENRKFKLSQPDIECSFDDAVSDESQIILELAKKNDDKEKSKLVDYLNQAAKVADFRSKEKHELPELKGMKFNKLGKKLIFLGDDLADRGNSDAMTLDLFDKLAESGNDYSVIFSNHSLWFFEVAQGIDDILNKKPQRRFNSIEDIQKYVAEQDGGPIARQAGSLLNFVTRSEDELKKYIELYKQKYVPHLKLLDYTFEANGTIRFYSHAPINLKVIEMLARGHGVWPDDKANINALTAEEVGKLIDDLNSKFRENLESGKIDYAKLNKFVSLVELDKKSQINILEYFTAGTLDFENLKKAKVWVKNTFGQSVEVVLSDHIDFSGITSEEATLYLGMALSSWNRNYAQMMTSEEDFTLADSSKAHFAHGHDSTGSANQLYKDLYTNLDNTLGKPGKMEGPQKILNVHALNPKAALEKPQKQTKDSEVLAAFLQSDLFEKVEDAPGIGAQYKIALPLKVAEGLKANLVWSLKIDKKDIEIHMKSEDEYDLRIKNDVKCKRELKTEDLGKLSAWEAIARLLEDDHFDAYYKYENMVALYNAQLTAEDARKLIAALEGSGLERFALIEKSPDNPYYRLGIGRIIENGEQPITSEELEKLRKFVFSILSRAVKLDQRVVDPELMKPIQQWIASKIKDSCLEETKRSWVQQVIEGKFSLRLYRIEVSETDKKIERESIARDIGAICQYAQDNIVNEDFFSTNETDSMKRIWFFENIDRLFPERPFTLEGYQEIYELGTPSKDLHGKYSEEIEAKIQLIQREFPNIESPSDIIKLSANPSLFVKGEKPPAFNMLSESYLGLMNQRDPTNQTVLALNHLAESKAFTTRTSLSLPLTYISADKLSRRQAVDVIKAFAENGMHGDSLGIHEYESGYCRVYIGIDIKFEKPSKFQQFDIKACIEKIKPPLRKEDIERKQQAVEDNLLKYGFKVSLIDANGPFYTERLVGSSDGLNKLASDLNDLLKADDLHVRYDDYNHRLAFYNDVNLQNSTCEFVDLEKLSSLLESSKELLAVDTQPAAAKDSEPKGKQIHALLTKGIFKKQEVRGLVSEKIQNPDGAEIFVKALNKAIKSSSLTAEIQNDVVVIHGILGLQTKACEDVDIVNLRRVLEANQQLFNAPAPKVSVVLPGGGGNPKVPQPPAETVDRVKLLQEYVSKDENKSIEADAQNPNQVTITLDKEEPDRKIIINTESGKTEGQDIILDDIDELLRDFILANAREDEAKEFAKDINYRPEGGMFHARTGNNSLLVIKEIEGPEDFVDEIYQRAEKNYNIPKNDPNEAARIKQAAMKQALETSRGASETGVGHDLASGAKSPNPSTQQVRK